MKLDKMQYAALKQLMQQNFVMIDLRLFLDTHPNDVEAIRAYNNVTMKYLKNLMEYQKKYGMLQADSVDQINPNQWNWIDGPWPWDIEY